MYIHIYTYFYNSEYLQTYFLFLPLVLYIYILYIYILYIYILYIYIYTSYVLFFSKVCIFYRKYPEISKNVVTKGTGRCILIILSLTVASNLKSIVHSIFVKHMYMYISWNTIKHKS